MYLRGYDYRSRTSKGIQLFLAAQFEDEFTYLQAKAEYKEEVMKVMFMPSKERCGFHEHDAKSSIGSESYQYT